MLFIDQSWDQVPYFDNNVGVIFQVTFLVEKKN